MLTKLEFITNKHLINVFMTNAHLLSTKIKYHLQHCNSFSFTHSFHSLIFQNCTLNINIYSSNNYFRSLNVNTCSLNHSLRT